MLKKLTNSNFQMKNYIIVIGRQYGGGGRKVGRMVADRLGIPYYDRELLAQAAVEMGYDEEIFNRADEKRPSLLRSLLHLNYGVTASYYADQSLSAEQLYNAQSRVIRKICDRGPCVIVGRTADYIMRLHPGLVSVFLHSPLDIRANALVERGDVADLGHARDIALKIDRQREDYYNYFTNGRWGHADNYHLTVDSSKFTADEIVEMIINNLKKRQLLDDKVEEK